MSNLEQLVKDLMEKIDEEYTVIRSYESSFDDVVSKQESKIRETAFTLLPVMEKIRSKGYYFFGKSSEYKSGRGPVLKYDSRENKLYVFSVEEKRPLVINLYNDEVTKLTYRGLLNEVEFTTIMEGLLLVLEHHEQLKRDFQKSIDALESELSSFGF